MPPAPLTALPESVARDLADFSIEVPQLGGYGNSGTRFKVFSTPGTPPRDPFEKIADAAQTHAHTGSAPRVSLHYPWDRVEDFGGALRRHAEDLGVTIGMINSNTFQDDEYKFGSLTHAMPPCAVGRSTTISSASTSCAPPGRRS